MESCTPPLQPALLRLQSCWLAMASSEPRRLPSHGARYVASSAASLQAVTVIGYDAIFASSEEVHSSRADAGGEHARIHQYHASAGTPGLPGMPKNFLQSCRAVVHARRMLFSEEFEQII
jgi:hypothetical protein